MIANIPTRYSRHAFLISLCDTILLRMSLLPKTRGGCYELAWLPAHGTFLDISVFGLSFLVAPFADALDIISTVRGNGILHLTAMQKIWLQPAMM